MLNFTLKYGLWITQIPGYPFITLGGAVAANVHGKSCSSDGTIRNVIKNILIFHKNHGWLNLSKDENKNIFDLTIGGFGLTGTIVSLTIKLVKLEGLNFITSVKKTKSISDTIDLIKDSKSKNLLAYSWNRVDPNLKNFGEGLVFYNKIEKNKEKIDLELSNFNSFHFFMNKINLCLWNKVTIKTFNYFFLNYYRYLKKDNYIDNFSNAIFPFRGKEMYFSLFGKKGFYETTKLLIESQSIDINAYNKFGITPLMVVVTSNNKNLNFCKLLVENGANVNAKNNNGVRVRKMAKGIKVKKYLKDNGAKKR